MELKEEWKDICNRYAKEFCEKHDFDYKDSQWIYDNYGSTLYVCDYFIGMDTIRYDIDNHINEKLFDKWYWKSVEEGEIGIKPETFEHYCNNLNKDSEKEKYIAKLKEAKERLDDAKSLFENLLIEAKNNGIEEY